METGFHFKVANKNSIGFLKLRGFGKKLILHQIFFISTDTEIINDLQENYVARMAAEKIFYNRYTYFIEEACRKHNLSYDDSFSAYSDAVLSTIHNIILNKF